MKRGEFPPSVEHLVEHDSPGILLVPGPEPDPSDLPGRKCCAHPFVVEPALAMNTFMSDRTVSMDNRACTFHIHKGIGVVVGIIDGGCLELRKIRFLVDHKMKIVVKPKLKDQLLKGAVRYWEGAAEINFGKEEGGKGMGYLEVTGMIKTRALSLCANQSLDNYRQTQLN